MKQTMVLHKALSILLTATMVFNMGLTSIYAEDAANGISDQCHTMHDKNCGYSETTTTSECTHEHTNCGYTNGTPEQPCQFVPTENAEDVPSGTVKHTHNKACQYASEIKDEPCTARSARL